MGALHNQIQWWKRSFPNFVMVAQVRVSSKVLHALWGHYPEIFSKNLQHGVVRTHIGIAQERGSRRHILVYEKTNRKMGTAFAHKCKRVTTSRKFLALLNCKPDEFYIRGRNMESSHKTPETKQSKYTSVSRRIGAEEDNYSGVDVVLYFIVRKSFVFLFIFF